MLAGPITQVPALATRLAQCAMNVDPKNNWKVEERRALIQQLLFILGRMDDAGEALAAIHIDMALNLLEPSRTAKLMSRED